MLKPGVMVYWLSVESGAVLIVGYIKEASSSFTNISYLPWIVGMSAYIDSSKCTAPPLEVMEESKPKGNLV